jgi:hypothetical protein
MPRSKDGLALFEIIRKDDVTKAAVDRAAEGVPEPIVEPPPAVEKPAPVVHRPAPPAPKSPPRAFGERAAIWEMADGRLILSFSPRLVAIVVFGLGVLIALGYWAGKSAGFSQGEKKGYEQGRNYAEAGVLDDIQEAKAQQPTDGLFEGVGESPIVGTGSEEKPAPTGKADGQSNWVAGYTYVVVQDFKADDLAEAKRAGQYLLDNDIETAIVQRGKWISLVTLQGFNADDSLQKKLAEDLKDRIRTAGERYFKAGGRVRMEGYLKTLTKPNW